MSAADLTARGAGSDGRPVATEQVRRANTALVLRALREHGASSRAEIAKLSGLTKSTVSTIIGQLVGVGAVCEGVSAAAARGRPGTPVGVSGERLVGLGVEVNVDYVAATGLDLAGRTVLLRERPRSTAVGVDDVRELVADCHHTLTDDGRRVLGVGVAIPGLVDRDRGVVTSAPNLGWEGLDLRGALGGVVDDTCEIRVDNDANYAAIAETATGVAIGARSVVYLTGTVGLGGGIVDSGRVLRGGRGYAGEVGHMKVGASDVPCVCGRRGCWEAQVGLRAMLVAVGLEEPADTGPIAVGELVAARAISDEAVRAGLAVVADSLAAGCAILANVLDPSTIVLGGYFVPLGSWLLPRIQATLDADVFAPGRCTVAMSALGLHAAATGAATEVLDDVFDGRIALGA